MSVELAKLNFRTFVKHGGEMYRLLDSNRDILSPWFWWAGKKTSTKLRFYMVMLLFLTDDKRKKIAHKFDSTRLYDEQFIVYNANGQIGGVCGLDDIDITEKKDAEIWGMAFKGNKETIESVKILENYCVETLGLTSIYGKVQSNNKPSRFFWGRYGYDDKTIQRNVGVFGVSPKIIDIYTYTKYLSR